MGFEAGQAGIEIIGSLKTRLVVGKHAILDTTSTVQLTGRLPATGRQGIAPPEDPETFSAPFVVSVPADTPLGTAFIYDWGKGLQELKGRPLGQLVFTRVGEGTADGWFQSLAYRLRTNAPKQTEYQGRTRVLIKLEEHPVKGTFKNLPFGDYEKSMGDLQETLKGLK